MDLRIAAGVFSTPLNSNIEFEINFQLQHPLESDLNLGKEERNHHKATLIAPSKSSLEYNIAVSCCWFFLANVVYTLERLKSHQSPHEKSREERVEHGEMAMAALVLGGKPIQSLTHTLIRIQLIEFIVLHLNLFIYPFKARRLSWSKLKQSEEASKKSMKNGSRVCCQKKSSNRKMKMNASTLLDLENFTSELRQKTTFTRRKRVGEWKMKIQKLFH